MGKIRTPLATYCVITVVIQGSSVNCVITPYVALLYSTIALKLSEMVTGIYTVEPLIQATPNKG